MKWMKKLFVPLSILSVCIALVTLDRSFSQDGKQKTKEPAKSRVKQDKATPAGKDVVIGYLHTRDRVITIGRGSKGSIYTVKDKSGKTLALNLNEKEFQAKYPELYDQVKNGLANDATIYKKSLPVDASRYSGGDIRR
jgi:hypothetical protein